MKFVGYTSGLECNGHGLVGKLVKIEISAGDGVYQLQPVSGRNLQKMPGGCVLSASEYESLPCAPDDAERAIHLLRLSGWTPMKLDLDEGSA